jgi:lysophospholipase L1-like esterase
VALIMIGTNDSGSGATDAFAWQMSEIVRISIEMGVIPVLSTIPPKNIDENQEARVNAFNEVIRQIARQYDVPLWDYYANMVNLPNRGMSSDGLHPSAPPDGAAGRLTADNLQYGFTMRNLNALQVLDSLWQFVMY